MIVARVELLAYLQSIVPKLRETSLVSSLGGVVSCRSFAEDHLESFDTS